MRRTSILALGALLASAATAHAQSARSYRVDANAVREVSLNLCGGRTRVEARGDGDTDIDFIIRSPSGAIVHQDDDSTDITSATISTGTRECRDYTLRLRNLGDMYNMVSVSLTDLGAEQAGQNRRVVLVNQSSEPIHYLYASRTTTGDWEEDILGSGVLMGGASRRANIDDGTGACRFDFKARYRSGREATRMNVNVCAVTSVAFR